MKMFKRIAAVVLAGVMAVGMMTACGGQSLADKLEDVAVNTIASELKTEAYNDPTLGEKVYTNLDAINADGHIDTAKVHYTIEGAADLAAYLKNIDEKKDAGACSVTLYYFAQETKDGSVTGNAYAFDETTGADVVSQLAKGAVAQAKAYTEAAVKTLGVKADDVKYTIAVSTRTLNGKVYMGYAIKIDLPAIKAAK